MKRWSKRFLTIMCVCLCLFFCAFALASGVEKDEDGGIWDYNSGTYTAPDGSVYTITPGGVQDNNSNTQVQQPDGGMVVITQDKDSVQTNPDGSINVESGQIQIQSDDPTRAPIEGDDWNALLAGMAAKNGSKTPTFWTDPETGESTAVEVVYMGVGRSMVVLNGKKTLVNTVDMKWETDAPEDKVLAMVDAPKDGYCWLRRDPNNKITNPKVAKIRTNTMLRVISTGKRWTLVDYDGLRGYVKSSSLEFFCNDHTDFETGYLSVKGKTQGKQTVKIRSRDMSGKILKECKVGTPVTVFDVIEGWVELDGEGFHGVIQSKYVTMENGTAIAD